MPKFVLTPCSIWVSHLHPRCWIQCKPTCSKQIKKKRRDMEWEGKKESRTGQSWEWGDTEHSVCCVYEGRTWHKHWPVCKSILCCSLLHACLLNTVFVLQLCTVTLRIRTATPGPCNALCHTGRGRTDQDNVGQDKIEQDRIEYQVQGTVLKICYNINIYNLEAPPCGWMNNERLS